MTEVIRRSCISTGVQFHTYSTVNSFQSHVSLRRYSAAVQYTSNMAPV